MSNLSAYLPMHTDTAPQPALRFHGHPNDGLQTLFHGSFLTWGLSVNRTAMFVNAIMAPD